MMIENFLVMTPLDHPLTASNQRFLKKDSLIFTEGAVYNYIGRFHQKSKL